MKKAIIMCLLVINVYCLYSIDNNFRKSGTIFYINNFYDDYSLLLESKDGQTIEIVKPTGITVGNTYIFKTQRKGKYRVSIRRKNYDRYDQYLIYEDGNILMFNLEGGKTIFIDGITSFSTDYLNYVISDTQQIPEGKIPAYVLHDDLMYNFQFYLDLYISGKLIDLPREDSLLSEIFIEEGKHYIDVRYTPDNKIVSEVKDSWDEIVKFSITDNSKLFINSEFTGYTQRKLNVTNFKGFTECKVIETGF